MHYSNLRSHPDKYLEDHLKNVANFSKSFFYSLKFENKELFAEVSFIIGLTHDFAKATSFFQDYIFNNRNNENKSHSFLSAMFTYYAVSEYLNKNNINFEKNLAIISYIVVLHHHGNIKNVTELDEYQDKKYDSKVIKNQIDNLININNNFNLFYEDFNINLETFFEKMDDISEKIFEDIFDFDYDQNFDNYFLILLFYSVLLDADKMDASETDSIERRVIFSDIVEKYKIRKSFNLDGINKIREEAYVEVNQNMMNMDLSNKIYSINLPTGIGKTLSGFSSVLKLKSRINEELGINPRIIYSLPFLSIIDQNESVLVDVFKKNDLDGNNYLLKHNHLASMNYILDSDEEYEVSNSKILIEGWNSEVIITTFIQLFYSIIGNKNSFLRKFHNIANSIILLDEIQSIPYKYWGIINSILNKLAIEYNCWIILMTATQPFIFKQNEIVSLVDNVEYYFNQFDRIEYNFQLDDISIDDFGNQILDLISVEKNKDILIVLNTINSSMKLYKMIKQYYQNEGYELNIDENGICHIGGDVDLIFLSTNVVPFHRLNRIDYIKTSDKQKIIISTQLIEAGVDIDVDIIYRDFAPLDSIIQTAGRCNRSGKNEKGLVNVVSLKNENGKRYSQFVYQNLLLTTTKVVLKDISHCSEKNFNLNASNRYFELISQRNFDDDKLKKILNFLKFKEIPLNFKLIENISDKMDVFVCINEEAESIFNKYMQIKETLSGFKRNEEFLNIKSKFYKFVISVDMNKFGSANLYKSEIGVIHSYDLDRKYKYDLGFVAPIDEEPMIF